MHTRLGIASSYLVCRVSYAYAYSVRSYYTRICRDFSFRSFYYFIYSMTSKHQDQSRDESQSVHVLQSQPSPKQVTIRLPYLQGGSIA